MKEIILDSNDTYSIVLTKTDIDAVKIMQQYSNNEIKSSDFAIFNFPCKVNDVLAIGLSYDVNEILLKNFIPSKHNQSLNYKCYSKKDFSNDICILHESATSAYYCALELLGKPKYVVIFKREKLIHDDNIALGMNLVNQEKYQNEVNIQKINKDNVTN